VEHNTSYGHLHITNSRLRKIVGVQCNQNLEIFHFFVTCCMARLCVCVCVRERERERERKRDFGGFMMIYIFTLSTRSGKCSDSTVNQYLHQD
jgi:hypothetical protein